jgi:hypothetical protein
MEGVNVMTIQEAIKSERNFRLLGGDDWLEIRGCIVYFVGSSDKFFFTSMELLSDDWELEPKKIEITKSQLEKAFISARLSHDNRPLLEHLTTILGLD